nr:unnamed protein product [Callosobruchus chinensis]
MYAVRTGPGELNVYPYLPVVDSNVARASAFSAFCFSNRSNVCVLACASRSAFNRSFCLPSNSKSSIPAETQSSRLLEQLNILLEYLPCFDIGVIDEELLQIVLPQMNITLAKIYDDNFLLSDTADDDFVLNMIREHLKISYGFMTTLKSILEFLMTQKELSLIKISSIPVRTAQILLATFDHCKKSSELYKQTYNMELLELFRIHKKLMHSS